MTQYQTFPDAAGSSMSFEKLRSLFLPDLSGKSVLDVGCNEGFFCGFAKFSGASRVLGIDQSEEFIGRAKRRFPDCEFKTQTWDNLPEESFDIIFMLSAIHYAEDQPGLIEKLVDRLKPNGLLVLEMGVVDSANLEWVTVERSIDSRQFPTMGLLPTLLQKYAWKWMTHSVAQAGDPIPRSVIHISKRKPIAFLLLPNLPGSGKSTIARDVFDRAGITTVSGDIFIDGIIRGIHLVPERLREIVLQAYSPQALHFAYNRIFNEGAGDLFVKSLLSSVGHVDFALDCFIPEGYCSSVTTEIEKNGYMVVHMTWQRQQPILLTQTKTHQLIDAYKTSLGYDKSEEIIIKPQQPRSRCEGFVDRIQPTPEGLLITGWAVDERNLLPAELVVVSGVDRVVLNTGSPLRRPDVKDYLALDHERFGFSLLLKHEDFASKPTQNISLEFMNGQKLGFSEAGRFYR